MTYIVKLSDKSEVKIEADEVDIVVAGIKSGNPVKVRQGIFNPSYFVCLIHDEDRMRRYSEELTDHHRHYLPGETVPPFKMQPLKDIFKDLKQLT